MEYLERKFCKFDSVLSVDSDAMISGYASLFGQVDQSGDVVMPGAYSASLSRLSTSGSQVKMLWQHDPAQPIGLWEEIQEDARGLFVRGRLLDAVARGREALALVRAGALDGLSIGYRTLRASKGANGGRQLEEIDLWEVSLVTFPMLPTARVDRKSEEGAMLRVLARALREGGRSLSMR